MKRFVYIIAVALTATGCVGKMHELELSTSDLVFTRDASSQQVSCESPIFVDFLTEGSYPEEETYRHKGNDSEIEGAWVKVVKIDDHIFAVQVTENTSGSARRASVSVKATELVNTAGTVSIVQNP